MLKYIKCLIKRGDDTQEVLLPCDKANIGKKLKIKAPDESSLWEIVELKEAVPSPGKS